MRSFGNSILTMMTDTNERGWEAATWEGARRAQLRRSLRKSVRQRLAELEELSEVSEMLAGLAERDRVASKDRASPRSVPTS